MKTEKLVLDDSYGEEFKGTYILKQITWAKRNRILAKHTKYNTKTGAVISQDLVAIQAETMFASISTQPPANPLTLQRILSEGDDGIPLGLGQLLVLKANSINRLGAEPMRFLLEQLDEESRTRLLLSLGYVKRSAGPLKNSTGNQHRR